MFNFNREILIGCKVVGSGSPCFIIAEAGVNHNGDINNAFKLVDIAKKSGADAVKFQLFDTDSLILPSVEKAKYQKSRNEHGDDISQYEMLKKLELNIDDFKKIKKYCDQIGIMFLITAFDIKSLSLLSDLNLDALKISSTDLNNYVFLRKATELNIPIVISTGMSEKSEVEAALKELNKKTNDVILLQCTSNYPAKTDQLDLNVIKSYITDYNIISGYSDHSEGVGASPYAVAAGALVIEKHFTIDKEMDGPDHKASLSPSELIHFVQEIRRVESMMGSPIKSVQLSEMGNRAAMQKSIFATKNISIGDVFTEENIGTIRAGGKGIPARYYDQLLNSESNCSYKIGDLIDN